MTIRFKGIIAIADTKDDAVAAYVAAATGKQVTYMKSESGDVYVTAGDVKHDPIGSKQLSAVAPLKAKFASESSTVDTHISVCLDGCQKFILSDTDDLKRCPSCSASLEEVTDTRVHDVIFGSESDDLSNVHEPVFCGTVEQAKAFVHALRTGQQISVSGTAELKYDPFTGAEQLRSCSSTAEFDGKFHQYTCAANCSAPVTVSSADDVVFCAHCSAPLCENESMKISRINTKVTAFAPSLSAAAEAFRQVILGQGKAAVHDKGSDNLFVSASSAQYNPFTGDRVGSCEFDSMSSAAADGGIDQVHTHVLKCSDGCGFMVSSSSDVVFCSECMAPLVEPSEEDIADAEDSGLEVSDEDSSLTDLESDLAELDDDEFEDESSDCASKSGDEEVADEEELDFDDEDEEEADDESLSADDYDFESESEEDEIEFDEEDEEDEDFEDDEDFESESEDDEDEDEDADDDSMLEDDELDDVDYEGEEDDDLSDEESESSVICSVSAVEAAKSLGGLQAQSLSLVYNGDDKWFAFHNDTPLASLNFTALSTAINDEARAKSLFFGSNLAKVVSASAAENGVEATLETFGFTPVNFDVNVSEVCRTRAESAANERVEQINAEIESISSQRIERHKSAVSAALLGLTGGFWRDSNPVADALVNKIAATGVSLSAARDMVTASFRQHGPDLCANLFTRSEYLCGQSLSAQEEITRAIEDAASGSGNHVEESLSSIGKPLPRKPAVTADDAKSTSVSSASNNAPDDFDARVKNLM